jgi:hypothetical protein
MEKSNRKPALNTEKKLFVTGCEVHRLREKKGRRKKGKTKTNTQTG